MPARGLESSSHQIGTTVRETAPKIAPFYLTKTKDYALLGYRAVVNQDDTRR